MYQEVLESDIPDEDLDSDCIDDAISDIKETYKRINIHQSLPTIDYDDVDYRYAYVYLYGVGHTCVTENCAYRLFQECPGHFKAMMKRRGRELRICSLGGGPGCDVFGLLECRKRVYEFTSDIYFCVVDLCEGWETTLGYAVEAFLQQNLDICYSCKLEWDFIEADLCDYLPQSVIDEIQNCDILSMVKFISVVSNYYSRHPRRLQYIFNLMKPGAYVFFVDNSAGGFYELVSTVAGEADLEVVFTSESTRYSIQNNYLNTEHFEEDPLQSMSVSFAVWKKQI